MSIALVVLIGVLAAAGAYLLLNRSLTRIVLGVALLANAVNLLIITVRGDRRGAPRSSARESRVDPLPQAFVLTAIVIGFAITAFLLAVRGGVGRSTGTTTWRTTSRIGCSPGIGSARATIRRPRSRRVGRSGPELPTCCTLPILAPLVASATCPAGAEPPRAQRVPPRASGRRSSWHSWPRARCWSESTTSASRPSRSAIGVPWSGSRSSPTASRRSILVVGLAVLLIVKVYAGGQQVPAERSPFYHPAYLGLTAGVSGAFLAGDLFNLFVFFEILLLASYVLLTLEGSNAQIRSGTTYVVLNVVESTVLLAAVGLVYGATGTVTMAELPERLAQLPDSIRLRS